MEYGIVYLLTNPVMPGLVKIGMTTQEDIDKRMKELYTTGVPVPFECKFACKVKKSDCLKIEKALHKAFDPQRINQNREFFRINVEQAQAILELFHHEDVTEEVTDEIQNDLTDEDKAASTKAHAKRPPLNFYEMGLQKGDVLIFYLLEVESAIHPIKDGATQNERQSHLPYVVCYLLYIHN